MRPLIKEVVEKASALLRHEVSELEVARIAIKMARVPSSLTAEKFLENFAGNPAELQRIRDAFTRLLRNTRFLKEEFGVD